MPPWLRILFALSLPLYSPALYGQPLRDDGSSVWPSNTRPLGASLPELAPRSTDTETLPALPIQLIIKRISPHSVKIANAASGMSVSATSIAGGSVLRPGETFLGGLLTPSNSWRRRLEIGYAPAGLEDIGLVVKAVVSEDRQPWQFGFPESHGVTAVGQWQQNQVAAISLKFALLDSRIRYSGGISSSRYGEARVSASLTPDNPLYRNRMGSRSAMQWHRIDAMLLEGTSGNASAYFFYADVSPSYRTLQPAADMPIALDGRTVEFGANLSTGAAKLSLMRREVDAAYGRSDVIKGSMSLGPARLTLSRESWNSGDDLGLDEGGHRRFQSKAAMRISLNDMLQSGKLVAILPDALTLKMSNSRRTSRQSGNSVEGSKLGLELERAMGNSVTRIGITRGSTHRAATPAGSASQIDETWLDLSHSIIGEQWDVIAYGSINLRKSAGRTDRFYYGGLSLSVGGDDQPKLSIGFDADHFASRGDIAAFDLSNQGINISAAADFSYLLSGGSRDRSRYLEVKAFNDWSRSDIYGEVGGKMVPTVLIVFATPL